MKPLFALIILAMLVSCSSQKTLLKGSTVYAYSPPVAAPAPGPPPASYIKYTVLIPTKVNITDNGTYLTIQGNPASDPVHYASVGTVTYPGTIAAWKPLSIGTSYFTESADPAAPRYLWYRDSKIVLQTASIPLKLRSRIKSGGIETYPSQVETGFNVGFLSGYKMNWNRFRGSNNIFGQTTDKYGITLGGLFSLGAADLNTNTTVPQITIGRKSAMASYGLAVVFGLNSLNIGYAIGWDQAIGPSASTWIYKSKLWNGIVLSLDLIK